MLLLDFKSRQPIYEQLYASFARMAALEVMQAGEQLPSVRALAQQLGVNPNTVQKAYQLLERDRIIYTIPGKGSFIGESSPLRRSRQQAADALSQSIQKALQASFSPEEIRTLVNQILEGGIQP